MSLDADDVAVWMGIFRQLLFKLRRMDALARSVILA